MGFLSNYTEEKKFWVLVMASVSIIITSVIIIGFGYFWKENILTNIGVGIMVGAIAGGLIPQALLYPSIKKDRAMRCGKSNLPKAV